MTNVSFHSVRTNKLAKAKSCEPYKKKSNLMNKFQYVDIAKDDTPFHPLRRRRDGKRKVDILIFC